MTSSDKKTTLFHSVWLIRCLTQHQGQEPATPSSLHARIWQIAIWLLHGLRPSLVLLEDVCKCSRRSAKACGTQRPSASHLHNGPQNGRSSGHTKLSTKLFHWHPVTSCLEPPESLTLVRCTVPTLTPDCPDAPVGGTRCPAWRVKCVDPPGMLFASN